MKYLILLFLGISTVLSAQTEFAPIGAKWTYDFSNDNTIGYQTLTVLRDTNIQGRNCKIIHWEQFFKPINEPDIIEPQYNSVGFRYIHQQSDSILQFDPGRDSFILLFPLTINLGESFTTDYSTYHPFFPSISGNIFSFNTLSEDSIQINVNGEDIITRRIKTFADCDITDLSTIFPKSFINSFGPTFFLFYNELECNWSERVFGSRIRCYTDQIKNIQFNNSPCNLITANKSLFQNLDYLVYPNPVKDKLFLDASIQFKYLIIHGIDGRIKQKIKNPQFPIDVSFLEAGIYFLRLEDNSVQNSYPTKIIKQ